MRIGYLYGFQAFPPKGGNHVHAFELTQGFLKLGHSVAVINDSTMPGVINFENNVKGITDFINSIEVLYVRVDARFTRRWDTLGVCMNLVDHRPVVWEINAPANEALAFSWLGGRSSNDGSDKESLWRGIKRRLHAWRQFPGILLEEKYRCRLSKNVAAAICVSSAVGRYALEDLGISNTIVLPNGGPLISEEEIRRRQAKRKSKNFTVLYSGSAIYPWQGLDTLTRVIEIAKHEAPDVLFFLAVNQRTDTLPSSSNVVIKEGLNRDEILEAICESDVCVVLDPDFHWSKYGFHGSPMKMFEYMACMRPVVASNLGQMREILHDGVDGLLCANDPRDILRKLLWIRDHGDEAEKIGYRGWQRIQSDFNWPHNVEKTVEVFQRLLAVSQKE